jgi:kinetochore protein NDC80
MRDVDILPSTGVTESQPERIFFDYLSKSYKVFLAGNDDFDAMITELGSNFEQKNSIVSADLSRLSESVALLEKEYQSFVSEESPLNKAEREKNIYANDIEKFKKFMAHLAAKKQKFIESIERSVVELQDLEKELADAELQRASLQGQVDAQDIRPEDIDKMNAEKEMLCKTMETLNQAKEEASKIFWEREVQVQKRMDAVEKLIQEYNYGGEKSGLIPVEAHNSQGYKFELTFNQHAIRTDQMIDLDIKEHIQANLLVLREGYNKTIHETQSAILELQETLDRLTEVTNDKIEDLKALEEKIRKINQQYTEDRENFIAENRRSNEQIDNLDQDLQRMRTDMAASYLQSQQSLQQITIQYDQTMSKTAEEKERTGKEIFRILEDLINFKSHVEGSLAELDSIVKKEVSLS